MITLYWITVLGNISALAVVTFIIFTVFCFFSSFEFFDKNATKLKKKTFKVCCVGAFISLALCVLIPSKNELYAIYGVGSIIDYAKNSKEVQKLPDNAVKALNAYFENIQKENSKDSESK